MKNYLPQKKTDIEEMLFAHNQGNHNKAIKILCQRLPEGYVRQNYEDLINEVKENTDESE